MKNFVSIKSDPRASTEKFKTINCKECGQPIRAKISVGAKEFLDGYHGECHQCGWNFEPMNYITDRGE